MGSCWIQTGEVPNLSRVGLRSGAGFGGLCCRMGSPVTLIVLFGFIKFKADWSGLKYIVPSRSLDIKEKQSKVGAEGAKEVCSGGRSDCHPSVRMELWIPRAHENPGWAWRAVCTSSPGRQEIPRAGRILPM